MQNQEYSRAQKFVRHDSQQRPTIFSKKAELFVCSSLSSLSLKSISVDSLVTHRLQLEQCFSTYSIRDSTVTAPLPPISVEC